MVVVTATNTKIKVSQLKDKVNEVQWDKFIDRFLNSDKNQSFHHYFQISIALFMTFILANFIGSFMQGKTNYEKALHYPSIPEKIIWTDIHKCVVYGAGAASRRNYCRLCLSGI